MVKWYQRYNPFHTIQLQQPAQQVLVLQSMAQGSSGIDIQDGQFQEEYLRELTNTERADEFDKMRRGDAKVAMLLSAVKNPIRAASWEWQPAADDENAKRHADLLEEIFFRQMAKSWKQFLTEALSCVDFGHTIFEKTHKVVENHPEFGTFNSLACLGWRSPRTIERFNVDPKTGALTGIEQLAFGDLERAVTMDAKFLNVISINQEGDNYEGISMLRPSYGAWKRKQLYLKLMAIGLEKHAFGTPWIKVPEGKEASAQFTNMIETFKKFMTHESNFLTTPAGWDIEHIKAEFDAEKVMRAIEFEDKQMSFSMLANFLELGMNTVGSYALSTDLSDFFLGGLEYVADLIVEEADKIGKELIIMNFGEQPKYPTLMHSGITDKAGKEFAEMLKAFKDAQFITPDERLETNLRKRLGLPESDEKTRRKPEPSNSIPPSGGGVPGKAVKPVDGTPTDDPPPSAPGAGDDPDPANASDDVDDDDVKLGIHKKKDRLTDEELLKMPDDKLTKAQIKRKLKLKADKEQQEKYSAPAHIQLAETKQQRQITKTGEIVHAIMKENLKMMGDDLVKQLISKYNSLPPNRKIDAINTATVRKTATFKQEIRAAFIIAATEAISQAKKEVPGVDPSFSEQQPGIKLQTKEEFSLLFKDLPPKVRKRIQSQSALIVDTQGADLKKNVFFQYGDAVVSTDDVDVIEKDIADAVDKYVDSGPVQTGAVTSSSRMINESRQAFFFDDEVLEQVETFTFQNPDPKSDICRSLTGKTFTANDKEAHRLFPPLHFNCKSFLSPNLTGAKGNPSVTDGGLTPTGKDASGDTVRDAQGRPVSVEDALKSINLAERRSNS